MLSLEYIAGAIDCDGSISISYRKRDKVYIFAVNFRQLEAFEYLLKEIQETLGVGKIYHHVQGMMTWQTTKTSEAKLVCETLLPYLRIKKPQAKRLLNAVNQWESYRRGEISKDEVVEFIDVIRKEMNVNKQTTTARHNKKILRDDYSETLKISLQYNKDEAASKPEFRQILAQDVYDIASDWLSRYDEQ